MICFSSYLFSSIRVSGVIRNLQEVYIYIYIYKAEFEFKIFPSPRPVFMPKLKSQSVLLFTHHWEGRIIGYIYIYIYISVHFYLSHYVSIYLHPG